MGKNNGVKTNENEKLTEKEKAFCEYYCNFGCSGVDAIYEAGYKPKTKKTAYSMASENLRKPKILAYIRELYKDNSFVDEEVMREHLFLIKQHADLSTKARAIDMYYRKKGYYKDNAEQINPQMRYEDMSYEELQAKVDASNKQWLKEQGLRAVPL